MTYVILFLLGWAIVGLVLEVGRDWQRRSEALYEPSTTCPDCGREVPGLTTVTYCVDLGPNGVAHEGSAA